MAVTMYKKTRQRLEWIWNDGMKNEPAILFENFSARLAETLEQSYNPSEVAEQVLLQFLDCKTDEEFNAALGMFEAIVGRKLTAFTGTAFVEEERR